MYLPYQPGHLGVDRGGRPFLAEVAQVKGCPEPAGEDQGIQVCSLHGCDIRDVATGDAGRLHQHLAPGASWLHGAVVHLGQLDVGRHADRLGPGLINGQQRQHRLMDLTAIPHATT